MVHPFDRILSGSETGKSDTPRPNRRGVLKLAAGSAVAALAAQASGQVMTTMALGEEGGNGGNRGKRPIIALPGQLGKIAEHSRSFRTSLRAGDVENAADSFQKIEVAAKSAKPKTRYKSLVANYRRQLDAALTGKLKRADKDLSAGKHVPAVKAYRAVSRVHGFKQQDQAKGKLTAAAKLAGYEETLSEVKAQELYDTGAKAKNCDKLSIYQQTARDYEKTPTGKKAAKQAKDLEARLKRDEVAAAGMLKKARKARGSTKTRMLQAIVRRYPDTPSGQAAAQMLPKKTPRPRPMPPRAPGGPIATTLAIGEEG
ncbi:MAG: hypothetical protein QGH94_11060 [Phycisphaerae bacterium]|jgi:hypothetical protein|nr:hypothetical protein [Phycisphaerae bacterium]MDP7288520.1 hypothetical protein [Phycisphaerae bacterium]